MPPSLIPFPPGTKCWICGSTQKLTREHFPKQADTRRHIKPGRFYRQTAKKRNQLIQSPSSKALYLDAPICNDCNSARTQPFDRAWDEFRDYLLDNWPAIVTAGEVDLQAIYGASWLTCGVELQLYFVKIWGCVIVHSGVSIPLQPFRDALLKGAPHPLLYLMLSDSPPKPGRKQTAKVSATDAGAYFDPVTGEVAQAYWRYTLQPVSVRMSYVTPSFLYPPAAEAWHPSSQASTMRLGPPAAPAAAPPLRR